ncbi:MAG TPA: rhodanese-like domain-containing protein [Burkholderiaceae bacterium]|jgi:rhodanese-related sulfurtransferase|nr:rhodanese-like domain-containing protein [Burkholderiaceae bacterium]
MKTISAAELADWLADERRQRPLLLDVREPWETQICAIPGSEQVPMREVPAALERLDRERPVVCICHHGGRSAHVAMFLLRQGFADVYNLSGGVDAWARQVDPAMPVY